MKRLYEFVENDRIRIMAIRTNTTIERFYDSIGLFPNAEITLFLRDKKRVIIKIGKNKFAFSEQLAEEIYGEKV